ncbi:MAG: hypothetical protein WAW79_05160 [Steroidobacteraceae bacterium]
MLAIDLQLTHEVTSPQLWNGLSPVIVEVAIHDWLLAQPGTYVDIDL